MVFLAPPPTAPVPVQSAAHANAFAGYFNVHSVHGRLFVRLRKHRHHHPRHHHQVASDKQASNNTMFVALHEGSIIYRGQVIMRGIQSGRGQGLNNPLFQTVADEGPAPLETFTASKPISSWPVNDKNNLMVLKDKNGQPVKDADGNLINPMGVNRIMITPVEGSPITNRKFIEIHSRQGRNTGSHGCVTTPDQASQDYLVAYMQRNHISKITIVSSVKDIPSLESRTMIASAETPAIPSPVKAPAQIAVADSSSDSIPLNPRPARFSTISLSQSFKAILQDYRPSYTFGVTSFTQSYKASPSPN